MCVCTLVQAGGLLHQRDCLEEHASFSIFYKGRTHWPVMTPAAEAQWSDFLSVVYELGLQLRSFGISKYNLGHKPLTVVWCLLKKETLKNSLFSIELPDIFLFTLLFCTWCSLFKFFLTLHCPAIPSPWLFAFPCHLLILYIPLMLPSNFFINLFLFSVLISCTLSTISRSSISFHRNLFDSWYMPWIPNLL